LIVNGVVRLRVVVLVVVVLATFMLSLSLFMASLSAFSLCLYSVLAKIFSCRFDFRLLSLGAVGSNQLLPRIS
jgi:hypothetical protein